MSSNFGRPLIITTDYDTLELRLTKMPSNLIRYHEDLNWGQPEYMYVLSRTLGVCAWFKKKNESFGIHC